ncbi:unnamed protein product [Ilex paraguariensis]|uniref:Uncharacterized protein n=1 Tax=Ilex paraguariensis TaxID=185542 RepID=A0ABC8UGZ6_9AQUA
MKGANKICYSLVVGARPFECPFLASLVEHSDCRSLFQQHLKESIINCHKHSSQYASHQEYVESDCAPNKPTQRKCFSSTNCSLDESRHLHIPHLTSFFAFWNGCSCHPSQSCFDNLKETFVTHMYPKVELDSFNFNSAIKWQFIFTKSMILTQPASMPHVTKLFSICQPTVTGVHMTTRTS